ncbi:hypothetical protein MW887_002494 [Aspergillus wentii]|nr:hypothetical protein MW887_002494 [Aspergillus wentii]
MEEKESIPTKYDDALDYLQTHSQDVDSIDLPALRRKVDYRIIPFMFGCFFLQSLDKMLLNYAGVMGLKTDLNLTGNDFSNTATWLNIACLIAEIPNGTSPSSSIDHANCTVYFLQKAPPAKWLGLNILLWGTVVAASAATTSYTTLLTARIFLGFFEATLGPSLMLLSSQYYTRDEQSLRFTFWYLGLGLAQIIGGVISFGFQYVRHASMAGWRLMFLVLGVVTAAVGGLIVLFMPDTPMKASWLAEGEKVALLKHIWEAVLDVQIWLWLLIATLSTITSGVVATYSTTLIANFGFSPPHAALLNTPSGLVSMIFTLLVGTGIRRTAHRWLYIIATSLPAITGGCLLAFLSESNKPGMLIGVYLVNSAVAVYPIILQWAAANCAGATKRAFTGPLVAAGFSAGQIIGPQTFQARDAPGYRPAKVVVVGVNASVAVVAGVLVGYYVWENRRRDKVKDEVDEVDARWAGLTDKENRAFRYVY